MATSRFVNSQYTSEEFVESCGAVLFDFSKPQTRVCLIHHLAKDEWLLAKGRRNCGESRQQAALREVREETGYNCHLHPVTMTTRAPPIDATGHLPNKPRSFPDLTEPFMMTFRQCTGRPKVKVIWWYIAALDEDSPVGPGESDFQAEFMELQTAIQKLTFDGDRDVLRKAMTLLECTKGGGTPMAQIN